ncbi:hypothetical protein NLG97_g8397 [Lecanicillium saksenae]|uniref:Uncharacterized protein n=1 Tax=Lecanicillium saksenae TaxID=468837 RepID=A0ACC1QMB0_9HYPO|nr:hypothetical protein NLG97_g8397 [Lecanicillium saksenae]
MDFPSSLVLMALETIDYLSDNVEPHLSLSERLVYLEEYKPRIKFTISTLTPSNHPLVRTPNLQTATVVDAIVTQAIFGREIMMQRAWFWAMHKIHGQRLDDLPRKMAPAYRQIRLEFGRGGEDATPHQTIMTTVADVASPVLTPTTTTTSSSPMLTPTRSSTPVHPVEGLLDFLNQQAQEMNSLEKKQEAELKEQFDKANEYYPGLSGVLCGVTHSFRDRSDRSAERKTLRNATMEYVAKSGTWEHI